MELDYWRVTKYDPAFRDELGRYTRDEWTDFSCIGHSCGGSLLTPEEYLRVESAYVRAMCLSAECAGVEELKVEGLGLSAKWLVKAMNFGGFSGNAPCIGADSPVHVQNLADVGRLILRSGIWCILTSPHLEFHFGYDYYMKVGSDLDLGEAFCDIERLGLFVEPVEKPRYWYDE